MAKPWRRPSPLAVLASTLALEPVTAHARAQTAREQPLADHWGRLPLLALVTALGLLCIALADAYSRQGLVGAEPLFWLGLLAIVAPITLRLLAPRAARGERIGLVVIFGMSLYAIKVMQSPFSFTYSDEFVHLYNAQQIFEVGRLFSPNTILPATPFYPGLEAATAGLMQLTGLDAFGAGLLLVGLARLILVLGLFLFFEQVSGSARTASLSVVLYSANANFLFWSAQFSYESLALPLAILVLAAVLRRERARDAAERQALTVMAVLVMAAVIITHHITSYFLVVTLGVWALLASPARARAWAVGERLMQRLEARPTGRWLLRQARAVAGPPAPQSSAPAGEGPRELALLMLAGTALWLVFVARITITYLSPVFSEALTSLLGMVAGESTGRELFQTTTGTVAPIGERVLGISGVLLALLGLPFGLRQMWRRRIHQPVVLLHVAAALTYFALLGLRLIPKAWEIGNRSGEFLFIGLALVLAAGRAPRQLPPLLRRLVRPVVTLAIGVIIVSGIIAGWPPALRLAQPNQVMVGDQLLKPAGWEAARWMLATLGPNHHIAAQEAPGRYMFTVGHQLAFVSHTYSIKSIFSAHNLQDWQYVSLQRASIEYLVMDRRIISANSMVGFFFDRGIGWVLPPQELLDPAIYAKFDDYPKVNRIFDAGNLVIYDVRPLSDATNQP